MPEPVRRQLPDEFGVAIATSFGALGGRIWRIGLMGTDAQLSAALAG
ncbi:MAG TPA: hypothetical protein VFP86_07270 [bacterium]|nr:hypothetical protein [bacterium]